MVRVPQHAQRVCDVVDVEAVIIVKGMVQHITVHNVLGTKVLVVVGLVRVRARRDHSIALAVLPLQRPDARARLQPGRCGPPARTLKQSAPNQKLVP